MDSRFCHWCGEKLVGLISEFTHCIRCNERRLSEGLDETYDPCYVCMALKSKRTRFSKSDNDIIGEGIND